MCYFHGDFEVPGGEIFYTEIAEVRGAAMNQIFFVNIFNCGRSV
jgi:hypothetical protein